MARYKTTFERFNFGFSPALHQSSDVVFDTDVPFDDDNLTEFDEVMWEAMRQQNPTFMNANGPLPGTTGWSSVFGGHSIEKI